MITNAEKIQAWRDANPGKIIIERVLLDILGLNSLIGVDLSSAELRRVYLFGANLSGAGLSGFAFQGLPSGDGGFLATPNGWRITIGCWRNRTLDDLRDLIADRTEWPEAEGEERESRRPILQGLLAMCEAYAAKYPNAVEELQEIHGDQS